MASEGWYFSSDGSTREGPVQLGHLRALLKGGVLPWNTMVWRAGLPSWAAAATVPELARPGDEPPPLPSATSPVAAELGLSEAPHLAPGEGPTVAPSDPGESTSLLAGASSPAGDSIATEPDTTEKGISVGRIGLPTAAPPRGEGYRFSAGSSGHPWRRFGARCLDQGMFAFAFPIILVAVADILAPSVIEVYSKLRLNLIVRELILTSAWIPVEALFIHFLGFTPGKWLVGISIAYRGGGKLSLLDALSRTFRAVVQGAGAGFLLLSVFTVSYACDRLRSTGTTLWDDSVGSQVHHRPWTVGRVAALILGPPLVVMLLFAFASLRRGTAPY